MKKIFVLVMIALSSCNSEKSIKQKAFCQICNSYDCISAEIDKRLALIEEAGEGTIEGIISDIANEKESDSNSTNKYYDSLNVLLNKHN